MTLSWYTRSQGLHNLLWASNMPEKAQYQFGIWRLWKCASGNRTRQILHPTSNKTCFCFARALFTVAALLSHCWETVGRDARRVCFIPIMVAVDAGFGNAGHWGGNKPWIRWLSIARHHAPRGNLESKDQHSVFGRWDETGYLYIILTPHGSG